MRLIYVFLLLSIQFSHYEFKTNYLNSITFWNNCNLNVGNYYTQNLVQIFSPFNQIGVSAPNLKLMNVLQAGFIMSTGNVVINSNNYNSVTIWYRIIDATDIKLYSTPDNLNLKIIGKSNDSYLSIQFDESIYFPNSVGYQLWVVPIFPRGQIKSWSGDYSSSINSRIIPVLNSSIDDDYLQKYGVALPSRKALNLINRNRYTYLIIPQIKFSESIKIQLNPAIIYGCLSNSVFSSTDNFGGNSNILDGSGSCKPNIPQVWFNITCAALAFIILFILLGYLSEGIQIFFSSWLITAYFSCIGYHYLIGNLYESNIYLYVILFAIGLGCAIAFTTICSCSCKKGNRLRMFFNACCIILIILSIVFFSLEKYFQYEMNVYIGIGVISSVLLIFLLVCNGFTLTFGSTFIGVSLMCLGFSLTTVNSSSIPFLFSDFFNYILNKNFDVFYYSFFLNDDIIILSSWGFLSLLYGVSTYVSWRKRRSKKQNKLVDPIQLTMDCLPAADNNIEINVYTNSVDNFNVASTFTRPPPKYSSIEESYPQSNNKPTAPTQDIEPPPYHGLG